MSIFIKTLHPPLALRANLEDKTASEWKASCFFTLSPLFSWGGPTKHTKPRVTTKKDSFSLCADATSPLNTTIGVCCCFSLLYRPWLCLSVCLPHLSPVIPSGNWCVYGEGNSYRTCFTSVIIYLNQNWQNICNIEAMCWFDSVDTSEAWLLHVEGFGASFPVQFPGGSWTEEPLSKPPSTRLSEMVPWTWWSRRTLTGGTLGLCGCRLAYFIYANSPGIMEELPLEADGQRSRGSCERLCGEINSVCERLADVPAEFNVGQMPKQTQENVKNLKLE